MTELTLQGSIVVAIRRSLLRLAFVSGLSIVGLYLFLATRAVISEQETVQKFIFEVTTNELALEQPLLLQSSLNDLWAVVGKNSSIRNITVSLNNQIVAKVEQGECNWGCTVSHYTPNLRGRNLSVEIKSRLTPMSLALLSSLLFVGFVHFLALRRIHRDIGNTLTEYIAPLEIWIERAFGVFKMSKSNAAEPSFPGDPRVKEFTKLRDLIRMLVENQNRYQESEQRRAITEVLSNQAAQIAHDLQSPLTVLSIGATRIPEVEVKDLCIAALKRIERTTRVLLSTYKKNGSILVESTPKVSTVDVVAITRRLVEEKRFACFGQIGFETSVSYSEVLLDQVQWERILSNLINNSIEASTSDPIVNVTISESKGILFCRVTDKGRGMTKSQISQLYLQPRSLDESKRGSMSGSGLGLRGAMHALKNWNSVISIQSELGRGTTVTIGFPLQPKEPLTI